MAKLGGQAQDVDMLTNGQQWKGHTAKKGQEGAQEHGYGRQEAADSAQEAQCPAYPSY
jgi:hypothetical protein